MAARRNLTPHTTWQTHAACRGLTDLMYPTKGEPTEPAKAVCNGCPVKAECLEWALNNGERWGIWGGLSDRERRPMRVTLRARQQAEAA